MGKGDKTELQREILLTWYDNPGATNKQIADACNCSASYVSTVKNRFDGYNEFEAMVDRQDREIERMFGDGFFAANAAPVGQSGKQPGFAELWAETPNNPAGLIIKGLVLLVLLYVAYEMVFILFL